MALPLLAVDTETTGLELHKHCLPFFVSACDEEGITYTWEWEVDPETRVPDIPPKEAREIYGLLRSHRLVFHNTKFDVRALEKAGVFPEPATHPNQWSLWEGLEDTVVASHVLNSGESHKLKDLSLLYLDIPDDDQSELRDSVNAARRSARGYGWEIATEESTGRKQPKGGWWLMDMWVPRAVALEEELPPNHPYYSVLKRYATRDAERTIALWLMQQELLEEEGLWDIYETRRNTLQHLYGMESNGITAHRDRVETVLTNYQSEADRKTIVAFRLANNKIDNLASGKQLQGVLYSHFGLDPVKETKTGYSTDRETLETLRDQCKPASVPYHFIKNVLAVRQYRKGCEYLSKYEQIGNLETLSRSTKLGDWESYIRLHPWLNLTGTATTRLSSSDPNGQNITKKEGFNLRAVFGPTRGRVWYAIDYSNIELRIFAYSSGDEQLIRSFEEGKSVHLIFAKALHPKEYAQCERDGVAFDNRYKSTLYQWVKNGNFALIYGASQRKADSTYRVKGAYNKIRKNLPLIDTFMQSKFAEGRERGYVETLGGYPLTVPKNKPHVAVNYYVQGSAGWCMVLAINRVGEYLQSLGPDYKMILTIHDELLLDFPCDGFGKPDNEDIIREVCRLMEQSGDDIQIPTPVKPDIIVSSWDKGTALSL